MSEGYTSPGIPTGPPPGTEPEAPHPKSIFLVSYPKIVFLYPTMFAALLAGLYMLLPQNEDHNDSHFVGALFMAVLAVNLIVFAFDFPRTTSLTLFFFLAAVVLGILLLFRIKQPDLSLAARHAAMPISRKRTRRSIFRSPERLARGLSGRARSTCSSTTGK